MSDDEVFSGSDHDRLTRIEERLRAMSERLIVVEKSIMERLASLEKSNAEVSKIMTGFRGGMAVFLMIGGAVGWVLSHLGEWLALRSGSGK